MVHGEGFLQGSQQLTQTRVLETGDVNIVSMDIFSLKQKEKEGMWRLTSRQKTHSGWRYSGFHCFRFFFVRGYILHGVFRTSCSRLFSEGYAVSMALFMK